MCVERGKHVASSTEEKLEPIHIIREGKRIMKKNEQNPRLKFGTMKQRIISVPYNEFSLHC